MADANTTLKSQLHQHCLAMAQEQVDNLNAIMAELKDALGSESKSTAGDKHETGRAMIQLEQERAGHQLAQAEQLLLSLQSINVLLPAAETIQLGSLAITNKGSFYISVGLGKITMDGELFYAVSPTAPIAVALLGKRVGEGTMFNSQQLIIKVIN
jgi:transcription elongation GreA/GreB family factor